MNIAIDVVLALLGLVLIIRHTAIGFVRSVFAFCKLGVCVVLSYWLTPVIFPKTIGNMSMLLGYLLVFVGAYIFVTFMAYVADRIANLPLLSAANKFGGFLLGLVCAYIVLSVSSSLVTVVAVWTEGELFGMTQAQLLSETIVYSFFEKFGIFNFVSIKIQLY